MPRLIDLELAPRPHGREFGELAWLILLGLIVFTTGRLEAQSFQTVYAFHQTGGIDGGLPVGGVIADEEGNLYGTTLYGGVSSPCNGCGTVFKIDNAGNESVLYSFTGGADGKNPDQELVLDPAGNLYGVTSSAGDFTCSEIGCGVVFKLDPAANFSVLHTFTGGTDGAEPDGSLILDGMGNLYGNTYSGGSSNCPMGVTCGAIFKLDPAGNETILHTFQGTSEVSPYGPLLLSPTGTLFGTTQRTGGSPGTLFELFPDGTERPVVSGTPNLGAPMYGVTQDPVTGDLYGSATPALGHFVQDEDFIVAVNPESSLESVLHTFTRNTDGFNVRARLVQDSSGNLYGTTVSGGLFNHTCIDGCGVVFQLNRLGRYTVLHRFTGGSDGFFPGPLSIDRQGNLYGTTEEGGDLSCAFSGGCGTVFKITLPQVRISGSLQMPVMQNNRGNLVALVTITNNGNIALDSVQVMTDGTAVSSSQVLFAPPPVTDLAPGASATIRLVFPDIAATSGPTTVPLKVNVSYSESSMLLSGGNWTLSFRGVTVKRGQ
jgi:uncharacterized repeat protein (TIGR03803 family)